MRLVYLDEAGISKDEPFLTVGAVVVHADTQLVAVERHLDRLVARWIPEEHSDSFVFHAKELFNGGGVFKRDQWPLEKRLAIAEELAKLPKRHGLRLGLAVVEKARHDESEEDIREAWANASERERAIFHHAAAFSACVMGVNNWVKANHPNEICLLISEDNDQARQTIRDVIRYQQSANAKVAFGGSYERLFPLTKIKEDPVFQSKRSSSVLQLADFWAYVAKRRYMGDMRYSALYRLMRPMAVTPIFPPDAVAVEERAIGSSSTAQRPAQSRS